MSSYTNLMHRLAKGQSTADWLSKADDADLYDVAAHDIDEVVARDARRWLIIRATDKIDARIAARGGSR